MLVTRVPPEPTGEWPEGAVHREPRLGLVPSDLEALLARSGELADLAVLGPHAHWALGELLGLHDGVVQVGTFSKSAR
jgi:hypothetical protein